MFHIYHWFPLIVYSFLILFLSSEKIPEEMQIIPDFILHTCEYMVLGLFLYFAFFTTFSIQPVKLVFYLTGIGMIIGVFDEIIQSFTPSRVGSLKDLFVDLIALFLSQVILYHMNKNNKLITKKIIE